MTAVERQFPNPPSTSPQWLALAEAVFNDMAYRWDTTSCNGGLKWQIFTFNKGYDYKNAISQGTLFQLAARLTRHTGNQTYLDWAEKVWDWTAAIGLIGGNYRVFDGSDDLLNCSEINHIEWTYNTAVFLYGSAILQNYTNGSTLWTDRTTGLLGASTSFFSPYKNATNIMFEPACEPGSACNTDQLSFKAYLSRWLAATTKMAPATLPAVMQLLRTSAEAAARSCSGGSNGQTCGTKWYVGGWDGTAGVGQQLSALEVVQGLLVNVTSPPAVQRNVHIIEATSTAIITLPTGGPPPPTSPRRVNGGAFLQPRGLFAVLMTGIMTLLLL